MPRKQAPSLDPQQIVRFLADEVGRPVRTRELAHLMDLPERSYRAFRSTVQALLADGRLVRLKRGRIAPPDSLNLVTGTVMVRRGGHIFCRVDAAEGSPTSGAIEEIFIRPRERSTALKGDRVMVRRHADRDGPSAEGAIIKILERGGAPVLGIYHRSRHFSYVVPDAPHPLREILVPKQYAGGAEVGQQVMVTITDWETPDATPSGRITEILGYPDEPGVDIQRVISSFQLPRKFPPDVLAEARARRTQLAPADFKGREDLRELVTFTIDPADAKDHDDAVSIEQRGKGWRLGVHIADVGHYVTEGGALDREAYERATSVYLVDRVIPMLPERLSNDLCSLRPRRDRLTLTCMIDLDDKASVVRYKFCPTVIRSQAKLAYEDVSDYFNNGKPNRAAKPFTDVLDQMRILSQRLRRNRFANGALDLEVPEAKVWLDEEGRPERIEMRHSDESHELVEEFMLLANQCAAHRFLRRNLPCLYRVHAPPDPEKMKEFAGFVETLGFKLAVEGGGVQKKISRLLERVKNDPRRDMVHMILLRSLMKAVYQPENIGHFGLAFPHYAHFTSPIRRYPDLWVHRHLKRIFDSSWSVKDQHKARAALPAVGRQCSDRERAAEEAERESVRIKQLEYLESHLGDEFNARISGFLEFGFFATLEGIGLDGMVRFSGIDDDYYAWEKERWRVRGRRKGRTFNLGDTVRVKLVRADTVAREVDLVLTESPAADPSENGRRSRARARRR
ncbi:MAG TPA: ribonuclease R [Acidobacteriota bacterium]|nr:ribonuclease R [Acidobacteriota bacterium]